MKDNILWTILIIITFILVVLDFTGILDSIISLAWFKKHSSSIIIASLITLLFFIIKIFENNKEINNNIQKIIPETENKIHDIIINSLNAPYIKTFSNEEEFKNYYINKVANAKKSVDDLTWSHKVSANSQLRQTKNLEKILEKNIDRTSSKIIYREIFIFSTPSRIDKLINRLIENKEGYFCSYYDKDIAIPRLQFLIIDKEEVIFTTSAFGKKFSIKNKIVVEMLIDYFNVAWEKSKCLKKGNEWFIDNIKNIVKEEELKEILKICRNNSQIKQIDGTAQCFG